MILKLITKISENINSRIFKSFINTFKKEIKTSKIPRKFCKHFSS